MQKGFIGAQFPELQGEAVLNFAMHKPLKAKPTSHHENG
jgi:hypothetical protein